MADILEGRDVAKLLGNLVYEKKQVHAESVDLTVKSVSRIATTGSLDFGGSEYESGRRIELEARKADPSDKYGWWFLAAGDFLIEYNEELSLPPHHLGILQPHERLIETGATHGVRIITEPGEKLVSLMHVGQADVRIKQNARISELVVLRHD